VKVMDGGSWALSDWQATNATGLRKTIALRIRQTRHVAEAVSVRFAAVIAECFTRILKRCHSRLKSRVLLFFLRRLESVDGDPIFDRCFTFYAGRISHLGAFPRHAENVGSVLENRTRDSQPFHLGQQCGSFQSQFGGCTAGSANDPAGLLKRLHDQSAI